MYTGLHLLKDDTSTLFMEFCYTPKAILTVTETMLNYLSSEKKQETNYPIVANILLQLYHHSFKQVKAMFQENEGLPLKESEVTTLMKSVATTIAVLQSCNNCLKSSTKKLVHYQVNQEINGGPTKRQKNNVYNTARQAIIED